MCKIHILTLIGFFILSITYSQENKTYTFGFKTGYSKLSQKDELISPFIYSKDYIPFQLTYWEENSKKLEIVDLSYCNIQLKHTELYPNYINYTGLYFDYNHYRKSFNLIKDEFTITPGIGISGHYYNKQQFYFTKNFTNDYLINNKQHELVMSIHLTGYTTYKINEKNKFICTIDIPILAYIIRPTYSSRTDWSFKSNNFKTLNSYFLSNIKADYFYSFTEHLLMSFGIDFHYYTVSFPYQYNSLIKSIKTGIYYAF